MDLGDLRAEYARGGLSEDDATDDPLTLFAGWMAEARDAGLHEPNAMVVATADSAGRPSARMVLLKGWSADGFVFFTNQASRKGDDLAVNPRCALLLPWHPLERQVRVEGTAASLPRPDVERYFATRPRGSRVGAWASPQSQVVAGREELDRRYAEALARFGEEGEVPVPPQWGGYVVRPESLEFWQGRPGRMHDRLVYRRDGDGWRVERLAP